MRATTTPLLHRPHLWLGLLIYWALGQVGKRMNQYGTRAKEHWQHHRPQAYAALTNPEEYFTQMGRDRDRDRGADPDAGRPGPAGRGVPGQGGTGESSHETGRGDRDRGIADVRDRN
jgi:hypothetical protein